MKRTLLGFSILCCMQVSFAEEMTETSSEIEKLQAQQTARATPERLYSFDARSLFGGANRDIDLSQFSSNNRVAEGVYSLDTRVNDRALGQLTLKFAHLDANQSAVLCVDQELLNRLDIRQSVLSHLSFNDNACLTIKALSPDAYYDFDQATLSLAISLPLSVVNQRPDGYIAPNLFDKGITAAYLNYDYNIYKSQLEGQDDFTNQYLSLAGGLNFAGFNYRHSGSFDSNQSALGKYHSYLNVLSTDVLPLNARLSMGEFNTQTYSIDSAQIRGVQLATDLSMRPMSQRSYAPQIRGIAYTNALVSVFQNGRKVYERTVPAGNFEINDLTAISNNGDLTVQITENGGDKRSFIVPLQSSLNLVRVGQFNYSAAVGQYQLNRGQIDDYIGQLSLEYGLNNYMSTYLGTNISQPFQSYLFGLAGNTFFGGVRFDVEHAKASLANQDRTGEKYQLNYQYNYIPLGLSLNLGGQYQSREYLTLGNTLSLRNLDQLNDAEIDNLFLTYRLKQQYNISLYQSFKNPKWGSVYLSATRNNYWNSEQDFDQYNIGYSNMWQRLSYSLSFSQSENDFYTRRKDKAVNLSLSMPLEWGNKRASLYSNLQRQSPSEQITAYTGVSGTLGEKNQLGYGFSANNSWNDVKDSSSFSANVSYSLPQVQLSAVGSWGDQSDQYGLSARGGLVVHPYGVTLANNVTDTFTIVHAEGAKGADLNNAWGSKIDRWGNAIYANASPYEVNTLSLDAKNLPIEINLKSNQSEVIPRRYSSTLIKLNTEKTSNVLLNVHFNHGNIAPIGVQAKNASGQVVGMFGQSNQLFINQADYLKHTILVSFGTDQVQSCQIDAPEKYLTKTQKTKQFQMLDVECKQ